VSPTGAGRSEAQMWYPKKEFKVERTQLKRQSIRELLLKVIYSHGTIRGMEIARILRVPFSILDEELQRLKQNQLCTVVGGAGIGGYENMDFSLSHDGQQRAAEILATRPYVGPAPVDLAEYATSVEQQHLDRLPASREELRVRLQEEMVVSDDYIDQLGPALRSGEPLLLYGAPGCGKTFVAERLATFLRQGGIFVPYAIEVDGQIIKLFDDKIHREVDPADEESYAPYERVRGKVDSRWAYVHRPFVVMGGELDLGMLDLVFQEAFKVYEAPFQLKANCGLLLIDDLGRQLVQPRDFLNRWIYPLEKGIDYLTLVTGSKIQVPFRQMIIFSTNLEPRDLADEAFWRRIKYKVHVPDPTAAEFRRIFEATCVRVELEFDDPSFVYLIKVYYRDRNRPFRACHPRDLIQHMQDVAEYKGLERKMSEELVDLACATYFVD
jgi:predicted ATPase with chaperone activity